MGQMVYQEVDKDCSEQPWIALLHGHGDPDVFHALRQGRVLMEHYCMLPEHEVNTPTDTIQDIIDLVNRVELYMELLAAPYVSPVSFTNFDVGRRELGEFVEDDSDKATKDVESSIDFDELSCGGNLFLEPGSYKWTRYKDFDGNFWWYFEPDPDKWFYEELNDGRWQQYISPDGRRWWHCEQLDWFFYADSGTMF